MSDWVCSCGEPWDDRRHQAVLRGVLTSPWRSSPALLVPHRQWQREKLPPSKRGFVVCGDDGFIRTFSREDPIGDVLAIEWKSFGAGIDKATKKAFEAFDLGRIRGTLVVRMIAGNVPGQLSHYPQPVDVNGDLLPEQPVIAKAIEASTHWGSWTFSGADQEAQLVSLILNEAGFVAA